ncbi:MAG: virus [Bacteroidota bacterium]
MRGIFSKSELSQDQATQILEQLKAGVLQGKQFPFRYYTAFNIIKSTDIPYKQQILDALEECIDISVANMPKLKGKVACLSDNSGSAWGTFNSEYGKITIADIANLSSVITAKQADNGEVGVFGDRLTMTPISKRNGILSQLTDITEKGKRTGSNTENGLWLFWNAALNEKIHYDTVFIYSDMQAGRGELFGHDELPKEFTYRSSNYSSYLDVLAVIRQYRKTVNPKVNVFSVQVGGYTNSVLPETLYRGAILTGWTGKEAQYADAIIKAWDEIENK